MVIASSTALTRSTVSRLHDHEPGLPGEQVDPPRERRRATQMRAGETLGKHHRRLVFADVAGFEPCRDDASHARCAQGDLALAGDSVALFERDAVDPHAMCEDGALSLFNRR